jgi:tetratricopeptide (TPR) repeat protein
MPLALLALAVAEVMSLLSSSAVAQQTNPNNQSWSSSFTSGVKRGFDKIGNALDPKKPPPEDDAIALKGKSTPGPELYVAIARLYVDTSKLGEAEQQYDLALKMKPDYLPALLGYAELKERMGQPDDAIRFYQRAAAVYPTESSVHNNLALCFARQGRLDESVTAFARAIQLAPKNPLYRNNMATVLVDQGNVREAFAHLRQVHNEAAAHYNLGYLLNKKGHTQAAMQQFAMALQADPSMTPARRWIEHIQRETTQARLPQHPTANGLRITTETPRLDDRRAPNMPEAEQERPRRLPEDSPRAMTREEAEWRSRGSAQPESVQPNEQPEETLPEAPMPRRLPPVVSRSAESDGPSLPGISYDGSQRRLPQEAEAPMPPPSTNSAVRHLPRVN